MISVFLGWELGTGSFGDGITELRGLSIEVAGLLVGPVGDLVRLGVSSVMRLGGRGRAHGFVHSCFRSCSIVTVQRLERSESDLDTSSESQWSQHKHTYFLREGDIIPSLIFLLNIDFLTSCGELKFRRKPVKLGI